MPATDLLLFAAAAFLLGGYFGYQIGYRKGKSKGDADGEARRHDLENRFKELQAHAKELMGIED